MLVARSLMLLLTVALVSLGSWVSSVAVVACLAVLGLPEVLIAALVFDILNTSGDGGLGVPKLPLTLTCIVILTVRALLIPSLRRS